MGLSTDVSIETPSLGLKGPPVERKHTFFSENVCFCMNLKTVLKPFLGIYLEKEKKNCKGKKVLCLLKHANIKSMSPGQSNVISCRFCS